MDIYVVENDTDRSWNEPMVFKNGKDAVSHVKEQYEKVKESEDIDEDSRGWIFVWYIDDSCTGIVEIYSEHFSDYWRWRITKFTV